MKQFLLFAGSEAVKANGVNGFVADFDSIAEAFLSLVDQQTPSEWWHILDTQTGEVVERRHVRTSNGMIGFQHSDRIVGSQAKKPVMSLPVSTGIPLKRPGTDLHPVVSPVHEASNEHANGSAVEH